MRLAKRHVLNLAVVVVAALLLASCLTPAQQQQMLRAAETMLNSGALTQEEYFELRDGIFAAGSTAFWQNTVQTVVTAALAWFGTRVDRGIPAPPEERARRREYARARRRTGAPGAPASGPAIVP